MDTQLNLRSMDLTPVGDLCSMKRRTDIGANKLDLNKNHFQLTLFVPKLKPSSQVLPIYPEKREEDMLVLTKSNRVKIPADKKEMLVIVDGDIIFEERLYKKIIPNECTYKVKPGKFGEIKFVLKKSKPEPWLETMSTRVNLHGRTNDSSTSSSSD